MLKRQGVKRAHVKAQIVRGLEESAAYKRLHGHADIPDAAEPMNVLARIGAMIATGWRLLQDFVGFGAVALPFIRTGRGKVLRQLFPFLADDFAAPTPRGLSGREAYRRSRARIRARFQNRARYRKERMPVGFGLIPATMGDMLSDEMGLTMEQLHDFRDACFRAGILLEAQPK